MALLSAGLAFAGPKVGVGYLARVGPAPLRLVAATERDPALVLPPLRMNDETSTNARRELNGQAHESPAASSINAGAQDFVTWPVEDDPLLGPDLVLPDRVLPFVATPESMVPQMLLRYFGPTTNHSVFISAPVQFSPPPPPVSSGSSAVYLSP